MSGENQVVLVGNLTDDPELRFTPSGAAVASFTMAINRRIRDTATGEWKDGDTSFFKCNVWRKQGENAAESLSKGTRAIVVGQIKTRSWENQDGQKRSATEVEVDHVGPSLQWAQAKVVKVSSSETSTGPAPAFAAANAQPSSANGTSDEEPPF